MKKRAVIRVLSSFRDRSYIQNQKINAVKNLLTYSQYSYIEIATYLGYSSQSHLGKIFKEKTGYTLRQYRNQCSKKEFRK